MFCRKCGSQIPDNANICPSCGAPQGKNIPPVNPSPVNNGLAGVPNMNSKNATVALACGITSIVVAILGGIMFGIFGGIVAIILGLVAIVSGTNAKKETNGTKGVAGLVCGLLGLIFGVLFTAGCGICGCAEPTGYTCYGCVGASCKAKRDLNYIGSMYEDLFNEFY